MKDNSLKSLVCFLIILRFILAIFYPVFSDSTRYFYEVKTISNNFLLLFDTNVYYYPPLFYIIGSPLYLLFGELGLKLISPLFGAVAIIYTYKLGKDLFNEKTGLISAIILGTIPAHIYLCSVGYMDSLIAGLSITLIYYFHKYITTGKNFILTCLLVGLLSISKLSGLIGILFIILTMVIYFSNKEIFKRGLKVLILGGLLSALYYLRNYILFKDLLFNTGHYKELSSLIINPYNEFNSNFNLLAVYSNPTPFAYLKEAFLDFWGVPQGHLENIPFINPLILNIFLLTILVISVFYVYVIIKNREQASIIYIWLFTWFIAILIFRGDLLWGFRRLLPLAPALAILIAYTLNKLTPKKLTVFIFILLLVTVPPQSAKLIYGVDYYNTFSDSLKFIKELPPDSVILTPYVEENAYYTEKVSISLPQMNPEYLNYTTLKKYNITHIVYTDNYMWYNLSKHNNILENMSLPKIYEDKHIKIYEIYH